MKSAKLISSALAMLLCFVTMAQQKTITGIVSDDSGPLPGANVVVKGTTRGIQTDLDGKYAIKASVGETLVFSFIGLEDQSKVVGKSNVINVKLIGSSTLLNEVVVQGYGRTQTKSKTIGATQTVSSYSIQGKPNKKNLKLLQGQLAGANIAMSSGQPGTNKTDVIIRGLGTMSANNTPLYVINGVPVKSADFKNLNPNELESVTVLKDASATSLYGNRGSNGVVVITTKNGGTSKFNPKRSQ